MKNRNLKKNQKENEKKEEEDYLDQSLKEVKVIVEQRFNHILVWKICGWKRKQLLKRESDKVRNKQGKKKYESRKKKDKKKQGERRLTCSKNEELL